MGDWESEEFEPAPPTLKKEPLKGAWDDEDVEEEDIKESWEDEDAEQDSGLIILMGVDGSGLGEPLLPSLFFPSLFFAKGAVLRFSSECTQAPKPEPPAEKEKPAAKPGAKASAKKAKEAQVADEVLADPLAEKLCQQRLVEEADYKSTIELFEKKGDEGTLDNFIPKSESDFMEYAELISHKLRPYEKSFHYISLLKAVMRLSTTSLKAADAKEVSSSVTAIANENLKAEKEAAAGKKKQGAKKKQLHLDKPDDDAVVGGYEALDDYDFM